MICIHCGYLNPEGQPQCMQCKKVFNSVESPTLGFGSSTGMTAGELVAGRYRVLRLIKTGGMSFVYEAFDEKVQEKVALKILKPEVAGNTKSMRRFEAEVRLARRITHPNVCRIYDLEEADGMTFISMEYIEGADLKERIQQKGPVLEEEGIDLCLQICDGLGVAHKNGVIHRDLKPQNIMLDSDGKPRILDFGISHAMEGEKITLTNSVLGTPAYMSPEQAKGEPVDERSDIYAMGALMYESFTGSPPFYADNLAKLIYQHINQSPPKPREINPKVSPALQRIILKCLEKKKEKRYATTDHLAEALQKLKSHEPVKMELPNLRFAVAVLVLLVLAAGVLYRSRSFSGRRPKSRVAITLLPVQNQTGNKDLDRYMLPLTENLIANLVGSNTVKVFPYEHLYQAQNLLKQSGIPETDLEAIKLLAELNGSTYVVEPKLFQFGNRVRAMIEVKNPMTGETLKVKPLEYEVRTTALESMIDFIHDATREIEEEVSGKGEEHVPLHTDLEVLLAFNRGVNAAIEGKYPEAIEFFKASLQKDPGFADALLGTAESFQQMGYDAQAARYAEEALRAMQLDLPEARKIRIEAKNAEINYNFQRAEELYGRLIGLSPDDSTVHVLLGKILEKLARNIDAHAAYQKAMLVSPLYAEAYLAEGILFGKEGNTSRALSNLDRAFFEYKKLRNSDQMVKTLLEKALIYRRTGEFAQGESLLQECEHLEESTQNPLIKAYLTKMLGDLNHDRGKAKDAMVQYEQALHLYTQANHQRMIGAMNVNMGNLYFIIGEFDQAEKFLNAGKEIGAKIQSYSLTADACSNLASLYATNKRNKEALENLETAIELDRKIQNRNGLMYDNYFKGTILMEFEEYKKAVKAYKEQLSTAELINDRYQQALAHSGLGTYFYTIENFGEAEKHLGKALQLNQDLERKLGVAYCSLYRGNATARQFRFAEAEDLYKTADELASEEQFYFLAEIKNARGFNELQKGNWKEGRQFFEAAIRTAAKDEQEREMQKAKFYGEVARLLESNRVNLPLLEKLFVASGKDLHLEFAPLLALAYERSGEDKKALDLLVSELSKAKERPWSNCIFSFQIARLQKKLGDAPEALRFRESAERLATQIRLNQPQGKVTEALIQP